MDYRKSYWVFRHKSVWNFQRNIEQNRNGGPIEQWSQSWCGCLQYNMLWCISRLTANSQQQKYKKLIILKKQENS